MATKQQRTPWAWTDTAKTVVDKTPWEGMAPTVDEAPFVERAIPPPMPEKEAPRPSDEPVRPRRAKAGEEPPRLVCKQNYVAQEAATGEYGVIDMGGQQGGGRSLLIHVPPRNRLPWKTLGAIRPGSTLSVKPTQGGGPARQLRVRFTTPAKYYSPGSRVTTLAVAVDRADWECLMANAHRI